MKFNTIQITNKWDKKLLLVGSTFFFSQYHVRRIVHGYQQSGSGSIFEVYKITLHEVKKKTFVSSFSYYLQSQHAKTTDMLFK